jgi:cellulose biosynthesis protein BcsQ
MEAAAKLLAGLDAGAAPGGAAAAWNSLPSARAVAVAGVTGGAGATTLLASAASLLSRRGERIVLADRGPSLLPFYFGGSSFRTAPSSFIPHRNAGAAAVHLVTGPAAAPSDDWLLQGIHEFQTEADRILIDCGAAVSAEGSEWAWSAPVAVLVLTPEPSSLLRLPAVLERSRRRPGNPPPAALLVNQYDAANNLHVDIRAALSQRFGEHLLPFVIRRDPAFSECLASGGTVMELAHTSGAAADVGTFVDWLLNQTAHGRA